MNVNKQHKDRLFRLIFGSEEYKENTLSLYNALRGTNYTDIDGLEFTTMDDSIYMKMKNDVSFIISSYMELFEHQSTYNLNMPIRGIIYIGGLYDKYIKMHNLDVYSSKKLTLPTPRYVVFYNGDSEKPDKEITRLTDLFENPDSSCLEMTVENYNINYGHNKKLMEGCKALDQYSRFVERIKKNRSQNKSVEDSVIEAVDYCIEHDILKNLLLARKSEVMDMCITEYDEAFHIASEKELSKQQGRVEGRAEGRIEGRNEGEDRMATLFLRLNDDGRTSDMIKAVEDKILREALFTEYGL